MSPKEAKGRKGIHGVVLHLVATSAALSKSHKVHYDKPCKITVKRSLRSLLCSLFTSKCIKPCTSSFGSFHYVNLVLSVCYYHYNRGFIIS